MSYSLVYSSGVLVGALATHFHSFEGSIWIAMLFGVVGLSVAAHNEYRGVVE